MGQTPLEFEARIFKKTTDIAVARSEYIDNDLCFFEDYTFLFELLKQHSFLLTPHHYARSPYHQQNMLEANFRVGFVQCRFCRGK